MLSFTNRQWSIVGLGLIVSSVLLLEALWSFATPLDGVTPEPDFSVLSIEILIVLICSVTVAFMTDCRPALIQTTSSLGDVIDRSSQLASLDNTMSLGHRGELLRLLRRWQYPLLIAVLITIVQQLSCKYCPATIGSLQDTVGLALAYQMHGPDNPDTADWLMRMGNRLLRKQKFA